MKKIVKNPEPWEWRRFRTTSGVQYEPKPELRDSLLKEQGYICAYCMQSLPHDGTNTRIEHIKCRELHPQLELDYSNMVICCNGQSGNETHCDLHKKNRDVTFDLFSDPFFHTLSYTYKAQGVTIHSNKATWDDEINDILNLNCNMLQSNRKAAFDGAVDVLAKKPDWNRSANHLKKLRDLYNEQRKDGSYQAFCGVIVWLLDKRIARIP
ncbi:hypothetical protein [Alistipes indistinctus]|uniref:hypothetical protein n=1 Tax=Alistipes indistinctus TaxID=626932 RepID=UPI0032C1E970